MEITFEKAKAILATCPIGYYLGKGIKAELTREDSTCANMADSSIHISYPNIMQALRNSKDPDAVKVCRNLMYHEISHIILTPKCLLDICKNSGGEYTDIVNIFEDERIETILNSFYMGTNFNEFKFEFNGVDPANIAEPQSPREAFYNVVRFHHGKRKFVETAMTIIREFDYIDCRSTNLALYNYYKAIVDLYNKIEQDFKQEQQEQQKRSDSSEQQNKQQSQQQNQQQNQTSDNEEEAPEQDPNEEKIDGADIYKKLLQIIDGRRAPEEFSEKIKRNVMKIFHRNDTALDEAIQRIFDDALRRKKSLSGNRYGYDGRIDPARVADPNSRYRWFERDSDDRHGNGGDRIVLNLWVDCSSSFRKSEEVINNIIRSLISLEQREKRFTLNVISCSDGERLRDRNERFVKCDSYNDLTEEVFSIYKRVNAGCEANIQNLVVFDGENANQFSRKNNAGFNHSNVFIISDIDNEQAFRKYAPQAKKLFCHNDYAELLRDKVIETLKQMYR